MKDWFSVTKSRLYHDEIDPVYERFSDFRNAIEQSIHSNSENYEKGMEFLKEYSRIIERQKLLEKERAWEALREQEARRLKEEARLKALRKKAEDDAEEAVLRSNPLYGMF